MKGIGIVVSSKSAKDVLISTKCLHDLSDKEVYWLTEPRFFDVLPDSRVKYKVDISSIEAMMLVERIQFDIAYVFDNDMRGALLGSKLDFNKQEKFVVTMHNGCSPYSIPNPHLALLYGYSISVFGEISLYAPMNFSTSNYIFDLYRRIDDYVYTQMNSKLKNARFHGVVGVYFSSGHSTKKLAFPEYTTALNKILTNSLASAVVLFGPEENKIRSQAILKGLRGFYALDFVGVEGFNNVQHLAHAFNSCDVIISEDNFGLHLAIALERPCVGIFGNTLASSVPSYNFLRKVETSFVGPCRPCNSRECPVEAENCWNAIDTNNIVKAVEKVRSPKWK